VLRHQAAKKGCRTHRQTRVDQRRGSNGGVDSKDMDVQGGGDVAVVE